MRSIIIRNGGMKFDSNKAPQIETLDLEVNVSEETMTEIHIAILRALDAANKPPIEVADRKITL